MKTAFVFSGCGALGAFQAGVAHGLTLTHGVTPDAGCFGVSSGAVNAIAYTFLGAQGNVDLWSQLTKLSDAFERNVLGMLLLGKDGIFTHGKRMASWMKDRMKPELVAGNDATVYVMGASTGLLLQKNFLAGRSSAVAAYDVAMGACAIPGMCSSWEGLCDAGTRILAPLNDAINAGAERIFVISGRIVGRDESRTPFWPPAAAAGYYALDSALSEILRRDLEKAAEKNALARRRLTAGVVPVKGDPREIEIHVLQPETEIGRTLDFDKCREFVEMGKAVAMKLEIK